MRALTLNMEKDNTTVYQKKDFSSHLLLMDEFNFMLPLSLGVTLTFGHIWYLDNK